MSRISGMRPESNGMGVTAHAASVADVPVTWPGPILPADCKALQERHDAITKAQQALADAQTEFNYEALRMRRKYGLKPNAVVDTTSGTVTHT